MSIQSEITRLASAKTSIADAIEGKGVPVPENTRLNAMADLIDLIATVSSVNGMTGDVTIYSGQIKVWEAGD